MNINENCSKKILFVTGSLIRGGSQTVAVKLCNHFASIGYDVSIACLLSSENQYELDSTIKVIDISRKRSLAAFFKWIKDVKRLIKEIKPDSIISFTGRINIIALLAAPKNTVIVSERNDPRFDKRSAFSIAYCKCLYARKANAVVFQTEEVKSLFSKKIQDKSIVIMNPISKPIKFKEDYTTNNKVVMVGRLYKQKNYENTIVAFSKVAEKYDLYLDIYGEGDLKENIIKLIKELKLEDRARLNGLVLNPSEKMIEASFYMLTSNYEGLSNSLLEAMSIGMPCISTPVAGSNEMIKNRSNGIILSDFSVDSISNAIKEFAISKELREKCGRNARKTMEGCYSDIIFKKWEDLIK